MFRKNDTDAPTLYFQRVWIQRGCRAVWQTRTNSLQMISLEPNRVGTAQIQTSTISILSFLAV